MIEHLAKTPIPTARPASEQAVAKNPLDFLLPPHCSPVPGKDSRVKYGHSGKEIKMARPCEFEREICFNGGFTKQGIHSRIEHAL
jgi:hypothetical protein